MKIECNISEETKAQVAELTEERNKSIVAYNGRHPDEKKDRATLADMCSELITTGAFRRAAANAWARKHKKPKKEKVAKPKAASPKAKAKPATRPGKSKPMKKAIVPKPKRNRRATDKAPAPVTERPAAQAEAASASPLD